MCTWSKLLLIGVAAVLVLLIPGIYPEHPLFDQFLSAERHRYEDSKSTADRKAGKTVARAEEPARQTQKPSAGPRLLMHHARAEPSAAGKGVKIQFITECTVRDPTSTESKISVKISYFMLRGDTVIGEQPPTDIEVENGQKFRTRKGVTMPKEAGPYAILVKMIYKDQVGKKIIPILVR